MKPSKESETLNLKIDGQRITAPRSAYVKSKTKQLREFGYSTLTEKEVDEQLTAVLAGKTLKDGLDVIGGFIQGDIELP